MARVLGECAQPLPQKQFSILTTGQQQFDFGDVTVGTVGVRYFKIANDLQKYIKVELRSK